jgi:hypothetical protein
VVALVSVETVLLDLLIVLVAALLRSHAELLRRLGPEGSDAPRLPEPPADARRDAIAPELAGVMPTGDAVKLALTGSPTLLAFLSSGCTSCTGFWETLGDRRALPDVRNVIVTRGADREQRSRLRSLAPAGVPVVMSSEAWRDYAVPGSPYFVLVEAGEVRGEGVATTWDALTSLVRDAAHEQREQLDLEARLTAAGVGPDHPSLYPGGRR